MRGGIAAAAGAAAMLVLVAFGRGARRAARRRLAALVRAAEGPLAGPAACRDRPRSRSLGLVLSSATALWMTASTFGFLPDGAGRRLPSRRVSGETGFAAR